MPKIYFIEKVEQTRSIQKDGETISQRVHLHGLDCNRPFDEQKWVFDYVGQDTISPYVGNYCVVTFQHRKTIQDGVHITSHVISEISIIDLD